MGEAVQLTHRLESPAVRRSRRCRNTKLREVPQAVLEETWNNYQPSTRRPYGLMEWAALLRKLDRLDPSYRTWISIITRRA